MYQQHTSGLLNIKQLSIVRYPHIPPKHTVTISCIATEYQRGNEYF
ncbi:hypothetical protein HMPREF0663_12184 [Hoylesella oralis ATCC 33269]|uniref:Uncharacterized protein n=1 Tax=Hoylesella oralis ATCC 33269 TaxID=873533 RepID=E7RSB6_9BACT|nr:hypothetical protein HMPREF0663_12184 [Hoylesella oralis ATCC 33269]